MSADPKNNESLYLIDAHSLIYQVFFALPKMSSPEGLPTNALFGFTKDILHVSQDLKPTYLVVAFDMPGKVFRENISADYKANRQPMPDDLQLQIPMIREMLAAMNVPVLGIEGFEADDVLATLASEGARRGLDVLICSTDKDCRQLLNERVKMYNLRKREVFDRQSLLADWGIAPEQVVDFQTLVGDSVDNVKGVPGIGPKTATTLLQQYHTLENLLAHLNEVPGKKQENLRASSDIIRTSAQLVRLDTHVPLTFDWDRWRLQSWDNRRLRDLFLAWGFRGFAKQVPSSDGWRVAGDGRREKSSAADRPPRTSADGFTQGTLFGAEADPPPDTRHPPPATRHPLENWQAAYHLVNTAETFASFLANLKQQRRFAVDLETTHLEPRKADIVGIAVCWQGGEAWYLALRGPLGEATLDPAAALAELKPIFEDASIAKINQNIKYDMQVLRQHGVRLTGVAGDPMVADYLLHAGERMHSLDILALKHLQHTVIPISALIGTGKNQLRMDQVPCAKVAEYSGEDADVAWRLDQILNAQLVALQYHQPDAQATGAAGDDASLALQAGKFRLYDDLEIPLIDVLADMEFTGIRLDVPFLQKLAVDMNGMLTRLEQEIYELAGRKFNIGSIKQLREVLFQEQGFRSDRKTSITRAASTDQETLERLASQGHALPKKLLEQRQIAKLKGTYVDALPALVNPSTGRVHTSFNQTVATTGRLSSSDPNLQNIPIRSELGETIRRAFIPEPGWKLLSADYSQIELRLLAHFCGDAALKQAFADNRDIHASVAAQVFGVPESEVNSSQRRMAKTINFGLIYGQSAFGLAQRLEISREEAAQFIDAYFARYPRVLSYQEELLAECRKTGFVSTILGRRRAIAGIRAKTSYKSRNQPEREAINMQIQGSAADLIKVAMLNLHRLLRAGSVSDGRRSGPSLTLPVQKEHFRTRLLLQIHDELVFEVPPEELERVASLVRREMTEALAANIDMPLGVDIEVGDNWLDTEAIPVHSFGGET